MTTPPILECQDCGFPLRELSPEEAQKVATNPERYVSYCGPCGRDRALQLKNERDHGWGH